MLKYWWNCDKILPVDELKHTFETNTENKIKNNIMKYCKSLLLICSKKDYNLGFASKMVMRIGEKCIK